MYATDVKGRETVLNYVSFIARDVSAFFAIEREV